MRSCFVRYPPTTPPSDGALRASLCILGPCQVYSHLNLAKFLNNRNFRLLMHVKVEINSVIPVIFKPDRRFIPR